MTAWHRSGGIFVFALRALCTDVSTAAAVSTCSLTACISTCKAVKQSIVVHANTLAVPEIHQEYIGGNMLQQSILCHNTGRQQDFVACLHTTSLCRAYQAFLGLFFMRTGHLACISVYDSEIHLTSNCFSVITNSPHRLTLDYVVYSSCVAGNISTPQWKHNISIPKCPIAQLEVHHPFIAVVCSVLAESRSWIIEGFRAAGFKLVAAVIVEHDHVINQRMNRRDGTLWPDYDTFLHMKGEDSFVL